MNDANLALYIERVQLRTREAVERLPADRLDFCPRDGEYTAAELVLHISASRVMNAGSIRGEGVHYPGHDVPPDATIESLLAALDVSAAVTAQTLATADLSAMVASASGAPTTAWQRVIGGFIEHEVHHRSQLCEYLSALGVEPPPLFGLYVEALPA